MQEFLPYEVMSKIRAVLPLDPSAGDDVWVWPGNKLGLFSVSRAYSILCGFDHLQEQGLWSKVWKLQVPERVRCSIWLILHGRLLTNE